jgi:hypothetical protein
MKEQKRNIAHAARSCDPDWALTMGVPIGPRPAPPPDNNEATGTAVVARGRTVHCPVPDQTQFVGYDKTTGKEIYGPVFKAYGPGSKVELPVSEITRLRGLGFLEPEGGGKPVDVPPLPEDKQYWRAQRQQAVVR